MLRPILRSVLLTLPVLAAVACGAPEDGYDPEFLLLEPVDAALSGDFGPVENVDRAAQLSMFGMPESLGDSMTIETVDDDAWVMIGLDYLDGLPHDALVPGRRVTFDENGNVLSDTHPDAPPLAVLSRVCSTPESAGGGDSPVSIMFDGETIVGDEFFDAPAEETELEVVPSLDPEAPAVVEATVTYDDGRQAEASFPVPEGYQPAG